MTSAVAMKAVGGGQRGPQGWSAFETGMQRAKDGGRSDERGFPRLRRAAGSIADELYAKIAALKIGTAMRADFENEKHRRLCARQTAIEGEEGISRLRRAPVARPTVRRDISGSKSCKPKTTS